MNRAEILFQGELVKYRALKIGHELWIHFRGETHVVDLRPKKSGGARSEAEQNGDILAPMPGKILKVYCEVGKNVTEKNALIVMEAMKMEYTLVSPFNGIVQRITVKEGDQVALNQLLVHVEKK